MRSKRGVSPIIATVLLIGFMVALGAFIFTWAKDLSQRQIQTVVKDVTGNVLCSETSVQINFTGCPIQNLEIRNNGYHTIHMIKIRGAIDQDMEINLPPTQKKSLNIAATQTLAIIPVLKENNNLIGCADRKITVSC